MISEKTLSSSVSFVSNTSNEPLVDTLPMFESQSDRIIECQLTAITESMVGFCLQSHSNNNVSRRNIVKIQKGISDFFLNPFEKILKIYAESQNNIDLTIFVEKLINTCNFSSRICRSEYRFIKWLIQHDYIIEPSEFIMDNRIRPIIRYGEAVYAGRANKGILMPLKHQFKKVLEKNDLIISMLVKQKQISNNITYISNYVQGDLWKKK